MSKISKEEVIHVGHLARISLQQDEVEELTKNLEDILDYVTKLENLDVSNVEPTNHALPVKNVFREDVVIPSLSQNDSLKIAVEQKDGSFKVPKVIE
jgi:aspartyl-tRNA(Asn)/glutamyl-tRNA(Gln) amidotransferase subunit C